eukprot:COSAG02_NODE_66715_length_254_cov_1.651613_1_plen_65_part_01
MAQLAKLTHLVSLDLSYTDVTGDVIPLGNLTELRNINLLGIPLSGAPYSTTRSSMQRLGSTLEDR